jgi:hypothetical protein
MHPAYVYQAGLAYVFLLLLGECCIAAARYLRGWHVSTGFDPVLHHERCQMQTTSCHLRGCYTYSQCCCTTSGAATGKADVGFKPQPHIICQATKTGPCMLNVHHAKRFHWSTSTCKVYYVDVGGVARLLAGPPVELVNCIPCKTAS